MSNKRETRTTLTETARPKRIPVGEARDVMNVKGKDPNRKYRWVNDSKNGSRLVMYEEAGYRFETDQTNVTVGDKKVGDSKPEGAKISKWVGTDEKGDAITAYLMSIDKAWFEEDQELKAKKIDELEAGMEVSDDIDYGSIKMGDTNRTITINK